MKKRKSGHKIALSVLSSIILTIIIVSIVNVGLSIFLESPDYSDYCDRNIEPLFKERVANVPQVCALEDVKVCNDGSSFLRQPHLNCEFPSCPEENKECQQNYEAAQKTFNQIRYYVFALLGLTLLLTGIFSTVHTIQYTGLAAGGILLLEGIVTNFQNKILVFVSLIIILIIFGFLVLKKIEKK